uniref:Uncharacterized protein n=1 Tax=Globisporangium ultimum (strain ATCC 200006 / CBS 805.95 / DAOM BR144) TaxID=431595 RepID=K3WYE0_GLOUD
MLKVPNSLSYLKVEGSNVKDVSLIVPSDASSDVHSNMSSKSGLK